MNRIFIKHMFDSVRWGTVAAVVMLFIIMMITAMISMICCLIVSFGEFALLLAVALYIDSRKTEVRFDETSVRYKWLWKEHIVNLSQVSAFSYTIREFRNRYGATRRLEIRFVMSGSDEWDGPYLNDLIDTDVIASCVNGAANEFPLMRLYNFLAEVYPEKAEGYKKEMY